MPTPVDFKTVSTQGLESSPHADALAGLRANEARYFSTKYNIEFATQPAAEAPELVDYVAKVLLEKDIVISSRPLEVTEMMVDTADPEDVARAEAVNERMVARAIAMDGTCTGEHGVGLHKIDFLVQEHGEGAIDVMRAIKHSLDPNNILNPGKVIRW